jgi:hypothetical protein
VACGCRFAGRPDRWCLLSAHPRPGCRGIGRVLSRRVRLEASWPAGQPSFSDGTGHVIGRWVTDQAVTGTDGLRAYVYVADVDGTLAAVTAHGGQVVAPPYPEGTLRVALFADPAGNVLGVWQETSNRQAHR